MPHHKQNQQMFYHSGKPEQVGPAIEQPSSACLEVQIMITSEVEELQSVHWLSSSQRQFLVEELKLPWAPRTQFSVESTKMDNYCQKQVPMKHEGGRWGTNMQQIVG